MALSAPLASNHPCCISSTSYATPAWPAPKLFDMTGGCIDAPRSTGPEIKETEREEGAEGGITKKGDEEREVQTQR